MNKAKIAVLGAGSWGTALANLLSNNALDVILWGNEPEHINEIKKTGFNQAYLKDIPLSKNLSYATDLQSAVKNSAAVLIGTPSFALRDVLENTAPFVTPDMIFILACKGLKKKQAHYCTMFFNKFCLITNLLFCLVQHLQKK